MIPIQNLGLVLLCSTVATAVVSLVGLGAGRREVLGAAPVVFSVALFLSLALLPLPAPASVECPAWGTRPSWVPLLDALDREAVVWGRTPDLRSWLSATGTFAFAMNLLLGVWIGLLLGRRRADPRVVMAGSFGLSLAVELTQLTAYWGLYPCPIRKFDVDDLILNTAGVALGLALARR